MELEFPETLDARIKATNKSQGRCKSKIGTDTIDSKHTFNSSGSHTYKHGFTTGPKYETMEMTGEAMKTVKKEKAKFMASTQRALESNNTPYGQKLLEDS